MRGILQWVCSPYTPQDAVVLVTLSYACDQDLNVLLIYLATSRFVLSLMLTLDSITRARPKG